MIPLAQVLHALQMLWWPVSSQIKLRDTRRLRSSAIFMFPPRAVFFTRGRIMFNFFKIFMQSFQYPLLCLSGKKKSMNKSPFTSSHPLSLHLTQREKERSHPLQAWLLTPHLKSTAAQEEKTTSLGSTARDHVGGRRGWGRGRRCPQRQARVRRAGASHLSPR